MHTDEDRAALRDWRCSNGHLSQYYAPPRLCPRPGCGSSAFTAEVPVLAVQERKAEAENERRARSERQWH